MTKMDEKQHDRVSMSFARGAQSPPLDCPPSVLHISTLWSLGSYRPQGLNQVCCLSLSAGVSVSLWTCMSELVCLSAWASEHLCACLSFTSVYWVFGIFPGASLTLLLPIVLFLSSLGSSAIRPCVAYYCSTSFALLQATSLCALGQQKHIKPPIALLSTETSLLSTLTDSLLHRKIKDCTDIQTSEERRKAALKAIKCLAALGAILL